jgi:hypothetical protein
MSVFRSLFQACERVGGLKIILTAILAPLSVYVLSKELEMRRTLKMNEGNHCAVRPEHSNTSCRLKCGWIHAYES